MDLESLTAICRVVSGPNISEKVAEEIQSKFQSRFQVADEAAMKMKYFEKIIRKHEQLAASSKQQSENASSLSQLDPILPQEEEVPICNPSQAGTLTSGSLVPYSVADSSDSEGDYDQGTGDFMTVETLVDSGIHAEGQKEDQEQLEEFDERHSDDSVDSVVLFPDGPPQWTRESPLPPRLEALDSDGDSDDSVESVVLFQDVPPHRVLAMQNKENSVRTEEAQEGIDLVVENLEKSPMERNVITPAAAKENKHRLLSYLRIAEEHKHGLLFLNLSKNKNYQLVCKRPVDLIGLRRAIQSGEVCDKETLLAQLSLMFLNAAMFWSSDDVERKCAEEMWNEVFPQITQFMEDVESFVPGSHNSAGARRRSNFL